MDIYTTKLLTTATQTYYTVENDLNAADADLANFNWKPAPSLNRKLDFTESSRSASRDYYERRPHKRHQQASGIGS